MIFEHSSYRTFLKEEYLRRKGKNKSYSLRAFARDIASDVAQVSRVFKGTKKLSLEKAMQVASSLGLSGKEAEYFYLLVQFDSAKDPALKESIMGRLNELNGRKQVADLSLDLFRTISDWYHLPILEMTQLDGFVTNAKNCAKRLGISEVEASLALERLERLELIEPHPTKGFKKTTPFIQFRSPVPNQALRNYHAQMIEKARESVHTQDPAERYLGSENFAFDVSMIDEAKADLDQFKQRFARKYHKGKRLTEAYHLGIQFFRLTTKEKK